MGHVGKFLVFIEEFRVRGIWVSLPGSLIRKSSSISSMLQQLILWSEALPHDFLGILIHKSDAIED